MPIKEINIENIKIFVKPQNLKFAPITLLYGENSSGKTTLIKVLDILKSIFQHGFGNYLTDVKGSYSFSDTKKNLSVDRIHHLSSFNNKKPIKINIKLSIPSDISFLFQIKDIMGKKI